MDEIRIEVLVEKHDEHALTAATLH